MSTPLVEKLMTSMKDDLMEYIASNPDEIHETILHATSDDKCLSPRASYLLSKIANKNTSSIIIKHFEALISSIEKAPRDGQQRDLINVLTQIELDEDHEGIVFDLCLAIWQKVDKIPSTRFVAMRLALNLVEKYPELKNEITLLLQEEYLETLSPGIQRVLRKRLKSLD